MSERAGPEAVGIGDSGRVYVTGYFNRNLTAGDTTLVASRAGSAYLLTWEPDGSKVRASVVGQGGGVAAAPFDGGVYVGMNLVLAAALIRNGEVLAGEREGVVTALSSAGASLWSRSVTTRGRVTAVVGGPDGPLVAGGSGWPHPPRPGGPEESSQGFVIALDPVGNERWLVRASDTVMGLSAHPDGSVCLAGGARRESGHTTVSVGSSSVDFSGSRVGFVALLDPSGTPLWVRVVEPKRGEVMRPVPSGSLGRGAAFRAVTATRGGGCAAVGSGTGFRPSPSLPGAESFAESPLVAAFTARGDQAFKVTAEGAPHGFAEAVVAWGDRIVVGGSFIGPLAFGNQTVGRATGAQFSPRDGFVAIVSPGGHVDALVVIDADTHATVSGLAVVGDTLVIAGDVWGWAWFGRRRLGDIRGMNGFAARLDLHFLMEEM